MRNIPILFFETSTRIDGGSVRFEGAEVVRDGDRVQGAGGYISPEMRPGYPHDGISTCVGDDQEFFAAYGPLEPLEG